MSAAAIVMRERIQGNGVERDRKHLLIACAAAVLAGAIAYLPTFVGMVRTWLSTDTYVHGFVILPIVAFLIWRLRAELALLPWRPASAGLAVLLMLTLAWFTAARVDIRLVEQLAAVAMLPALIYTFAGGAVVRRLSFPLAYLVFAVPMGDELVPWLMEFTADFTVGALKLTGIAVYREGLMFSTSRGDFAVEKACSGVRYLIASVAVGALYAYLTYRSGRRRAMFIAVSALVPLLANGVRAYLIVVLAHASDMRFAAGADHIIYGWAFFGLVMFGLFIAGFWFREPADTRGAMPAATRLPDPLRREPISPRRIAVLTAGTLAVLAAGPILERSLARAASGTQAPPALARVSGDWTGPHPASNTWQPAYAGADLRLFGVYRRDGRPDVDVAVVHYRGVAGGGELATVGNRVADPAVWREFDSSTQMLTLSGGDEVELQTSWLQSRDGRRVATWVYVIDGRFTASPVMLKWRELRAKLWGHNRGAALLAASVAYAEDPASATAALDDFLSANLAQLATCLGTASTSAPPCGSRDAG